MKSTGRKLVATVGLVLGLAAVQAQANPEQGVTIQTFQFTPASVEVPVGSEVAFANRDDIAHTVTSGTPERRDGKFDHQLGGKGATAIVRLSQPGAYPYFCDRHQSMRGEIRVK